MAIFIASLFIFPEVCRANSPEISINELMWRGSSVSSADEFIELYNGSADVLDLSGYKIYDEVEQTVMVSILNGQIAPKGYFLISNNSRDYKFSKGESILNIDPDLIDSDVSLSNLKFKVSLRDQLDVVLDLVGDGKAPFYGEYMGQISSMQRIDYLASGESVDAWQPSSTLKNLDPDILDWATPENSGRPKVNNFELNNFGYQLSTELTLDTSFELFDSKDDFDRIEISIENSPDTPILKFDFDKRVFKIGNFDYCPIIDFSFIDKAGLSSKIKIELDCFKQAGNVKFNEIMFKPKSVDWNKDNKIDLKDEWIELKNFGFELSDLNGFVIEDLSGKQYKLSQTIPADGYIVLYGSDTGLSLNDTHEALYLKNPLGEIIDEVEIAKSDIHDISFSLFNDGWKFSKSATPFGHNIFLWEQKPGEAVASPAIIAAVISEPETIIETPMAEEGVVVTEFKTTIVSPPLQLPDIEFAKISLPEVKGSRTDSMFYPSNVRHLLIYFFSILVFVLLIFVYEFYRRE